MTQADDWEVVGDELVVPNGPRLSLAIPLDHLDVWLDMENSAGWRAQHDRIRDQVMSDQAADAIRELERTDSMLAVQAVRRWVWALNERLGKSLDLLLSGGPTEQPSPETSGSDSDSEPTEPASTTP
ncbi:hypothetical protein ATK74_0809 [Propionicimonas paludicola]|uniref:Uncharacterized protein n=1 Tax=Propionicimonas paludicola TaxID=185243 RepID=A0A2A9CQB2_9ACTN|nr:hypothetical protein [Propionicimonas paludicola]PFG16275.1 hypothetical protein ATK74_0809 [Propionicimonas paludicola]